MNRAQDDAMVSYIFQRTHSDTAELSLQQHPALAPPPPQQPPPPPHIQSQQAPTAVPLSHVQGKFQALRWPPSNEQVADFVSINAHSMKKLTKFHKLCSVAWGRGVARECGLINLYL